MFDLFRGYRHGFGKREYYSPLNLITFQGTLLSFQGTLLNFTGE